MRTHWELLSASDFFTVEVWTLRGLVTYHVLFTIHLATRRRHHPQPEQHVHDTEVARQITDEFDGALTDTQFFIMDRDTKFTQTLQGVLKA